MTPEVQAEVIVDCMNLDGFDMQIVGPGVFEFHDYSAQFPERKLFRATILEVKE